MTKRGNGDTTDGHIRPKRKLALTNFSKTNFIVTPLVIKIKTGKFGFNSPAFNDFIRPKAVRPFYTRPENTAKNDIRPHMHMNTALFIIGILLPSSIELEKIIARGKAACQYFSPCQPVQNEKVWAKSCKSVKPRIASCVLRAHLV